MRALLMGLLLICGSPAQQKPDPLALTTDEKIRLLEDSNRELNTQVQLLTLTLEYQAPGIAKKSYDATLQTVLNLRQQLGEQIQKHREDFEGIKKAHQCFDCVLRPDYVLERPRK